jgi:hypothetical protein
MDGLAALKKKNERALKQYHHQTGSIGKYTAANGQYSQWQSLIHKRRHRPGPE